MKEKNDELTEYSKGGGIEIGGKTQRQNKGEGRKEADAGDTHLRAWDRVYIADVEVAASGRYLGRGPRRVATHNDADAFVIHVTIVRDVG